MAELQGKVVEPEAYRLCEWGAIAGGAITIIGGLLLVMLGLLVFGAYLHSQKDFLTPLTAAILSGSALAIVGGFDAIMSRFYLRALVGSTMPALFFLGWFVMANINEPGSWMMVLPLGIMGIAGTLFVALSRRAFSDGSPKERAEAEEAWRKRLVKSTSWVVAITAILMVAIVAGIRLHITIIIGTLCFLIPALFGMMFLLSYVLWLRLSYLRERSS